MSARGLNLTGLETGVRAFALEAKKYGATAERMLVLLKNCLRDERRPDSDRAQYEAFRSAAVNWAIDAYHGRDS